LTQQVIGKTTQVVGYGQMAWLLADAWPADVQEPAEDIIVGGDRSMWWLQVGCLALDRT